VTTLYFHQRFVVCSNDVRRVTLLAEIAKVLAFLKVLQSYHFLFALLLAIQAFYTDLLPFKGTTVYNCLRCVQRHATIRLDVFL
jgi:chloramphenicol O-acetyltransferase